MMGVNTTYTRLEEQETLIDMENSIFCESTKFEGGLLSGFGTVELENSLRFDKKYFSIIKGFQLQRPMIYYLQVDANLLTFWTMPCISYFHFL